MYYLYSEKPDEYYVEKRFKKDYFVGTFTNKRELADLLVGLGENPEIARELSTFIWKNRDIAIEDPCKNN